VYSINSLTHKKNLLGEDIFKPTIGNENLHEVLNDNSLK
jgi:hypothetical protein